MTGKLFLPPRPTVVATSAGKVWHRLSCRVQRRRGAAAWPRIRWLEPERPMPAAQSTTEVDGARLLNCARCGVPVWVCRSCDRGQRYCSRQCSEQSRHESVREAGRRYQCGRVGRFAHARRAKVYRQRVRQKIVTHQGSQQRAADAVLGADPEAQSIVEQTTACLPVLPWRCHWCARPCRRVVARGLPPHASEDRVRQSDAQPSSRRSPGAPHGQSP